MSDIEPIIKLNLGCGNARIPGFINVDIREHIKPDIVDDIAILEKFLPDSVDLIYASHVLEHIRRTTYMDVLKRWYDLIKVGGTLRIAVPDFEAVVNRYNETKDVAALIGFLYGKQDHPFNVHYYCWDFKSLKNDLEIVGFKNVRRYDWRETEHADIDDYSQSYLPHMQKETGVLMSLNVEGIK